jgi:hypothetical protein
LKNSNSFLEDFDTPNLNPILLSNAKKLKTTNSEGPSRRNNLNISLQRVDNQVKVSPQKLQKKGSFTKAEHSTQGSSQRKDSEEGGE